jgi:hypothetical protein
MVALWLACLVLPCFVLSCQDTTAQLTDAEVLEMNGEVLSSLQLLVFFPFFCGLCLGLFGFV